MANQPKKYKKFVATAATATLVASAIVPVASAASFSDTTGNTHEAAISALSDAGIIKGYADGTFKPNKELTRSDVVKLLGKYLVTEGYSIPEDYKTNVRFSDLKATSNDELLQYAAVVADNGIFAGSNGKLLAGDPITRENMAIVLVRMVNTLKDVSLEEFVATQDFTKEVKDIKVAKAEAQSAINVLDFYDITTATNFLPKNTVTRGQFATFLNNVINADFSGAAVTGTVKAINNVTVEVTFPEAVKDIKDLNFKIEGLEVKNAVVKLTDNKTVVVTTTAQEAGKEYKVTVNGNNVGKFVGLSAVLPKSVKLTTNSQQAVYGQQVTVKAQVTVEEGKSKAGIPLTFVIASNGVNATPSYIEVRTNEEGIAEHTYTQYTGSEDTVTAYATAQADIRNSSAKVYWGNNLRLTVKDITEGSLFANGAKKVYEINSPENRGGYVFVTFEENLNIAPDKAVKGAYVEGVNTYPVLTSTSVINPLPTTVEGKPYPHQFTTGGKAVTVVKLDANGKANLVVTGSNAAVTPVVYAGSSSIDVTGNVFSLPEYTSTALQTKASKVTFELKHVLGLTIKAEGVQRAAKYINTDETGGRDYTITYTGQDGKPAAPNTVVTVALPKIGGAVFLVDKDGNEVTPYTFDDVNNYYRVLVGAKGEAKFTVGSKTVNTYVEPIAFIDNGTKANALDTADLQAKAEITYFVEEVTYAAELDADVKTLLKGEKSKVTYTLVDQNGKPRSFDAETNVAFEITAGTSAVTVEGTTSPILPGTTGTVKATIGKNKTEASVTISAADPSSVVVTATGSKAGVVLPTTNPTSVVVNFTQYGATAATGKAVDVNTALDVLTINKVIYNYADAAYRYNNNVITKAAFEDYIKDNGATVSVTLDTEGKFTFNVIATTVGPKTPGADALAEQVEKVKELDETKYTADSFDKVKAALAAAAALPVTANDAEKKAAADAIEAAIKALEAAPEKPVVEGLEITSFVGTEIETIFGASGLFNYVVTGTIAEGTTAPAKLTLVLTTTDAGELSYEGTVVVSKDGKSFTISFGDANFDEDYDAITSVNLDGQAKVELK